jgi:hypothetical protein
MTGFRVKSWLEFQQIKVPCVLIRSQMLPTLFCELLPYNKCVLALSPERENMTYRRPARTLSRESVKDLEERESVECKYIDTQGLVIVEWGHSKTEKIGSSLCWQIRQNEVLIVHRKVDTDIWVRKEASFSNR